MSTSVDEEMTVQLNDLSIGILVKYGDFRYLVAGDLTGNRTKKVAEVEQLIVDDVADLDVYHANHHGSTTSSVPDFMEAIKPTVVIVSNGRDHNHPSRTVIENNILSLDPKPEVYLTNHNNQQHAWKAG